MSNDSQAAAVDDASQRPEWQQALDELERSLGDASRAIALLRRSLEGDGEEARPAAVAPAHRRTPAPPPEPAAPAEDTGGRSAFERLWDRVEHERLEKQGERLPEPLLERRGLDLLPQQYLMTVEDRERQVDLVPLHRALLGLAKMEDITLVSFANGVPVISLRVEGELDLGRLVEAVSAATDQRCEVIPQDTNRLHLRLHSRQDDQGG